MPVKYIGLHGITIKTMLSANVMHMHILQSFNICLCLLIICVLISCVAKMVPLHEPLPIDILYADRFEYETLVPLKKGSNPSKIWDLIKEPWKLLN